MALVVRRKRLYNIIIIIQVTLVGSTCIVIGFFFLIFHYSNVRTVYGTKLRCHLA